MTDDLESRLGGVIGDDAPERPTKTALTTRRRRPHLRVALVGAVVWVLLWGDLSVANLVSGFILGLLITWVFPLPPIDFHGRLRLWAHTKLIAVLLFDLVRSSFVVAAQAFHFGHTVRNAVVRVDLRTHSDLYLTLTSELVSLVPGSLVVHPVRGFGAIAQGRHRFCQNGGGTCDGLADFTIVWQRLDDGQWRITRVLSYGHRANPGP